MLRHVVLMRWKPGTSDAQKQAVREGLTALPAAIPEIRSYQFGDDAAIAEGNYEFRSSQTSTTGLISKSTRPTTHTRS